MAITASAPVDADTSGSDSKMNHSDTPNGCLRILIVCATFPPRGGSGIQRVYYQAELLAAAGHDVWVVTEDATGLWVKDNSFESVHLRDDQVRRVPIHLNWIDRIRHKVGKFWPSVRAYPDDHAPWRAGSFREATEIVDTKAIDVILVSVGSPSALEVAFRVKQRYQNLSLVIDVRDLWVGNPVRFWGRGRWQPIRAIRDRANERRWFSVADGIVNVSQSHSKTLQKRYPEIPSERFHVIQNGFDELKFAQASPERDKKPGLLIRYLGFLLPEQKSEVFFNALRQVVDSGIDGAQDVRCEFYGGNPKFIEREAKKASVENFVEIHGYVSHDRAVSLMMGADVLLLFWTNDPGCMCGKFYEYLRAGPYILAFDQNNIDARKVLETTSRGEWLSINNTEGHVAKLQELIEIRRSGKSIQSGKLPEITEFSRQSQSEHLAEILTATTTAHSNATAKSHCLNG
jgi:glycosyltransferase involved in cell wall biosynthesis